MKNIAIILSGGKGVRLGDSRPKQLLKLAGKKVIEHTLDVFESHPLIDEIAVVSNIDNIQNIEEISLRNKFTKLKKILIGGTERYLSSLAAIKAYESEKEINLIFHDAVRPLVNHRIITDCIKALEKYNAVDVAIEVADTIIQVENSVIKSVPIRANLRSGQTPQAFKLETIKKAYDLALADANFKTTDDCGVVCKYLPTEPVFVVKGEQFNMKLTYKQDLFLLDKLFQLKSTQENKTDSFLQLKDKVIVVFGGSYGIGKDICNIAKENGAIVYSFSRSTDVDISIREKVSKALKEVYNKEGKINYVINTAAILQIQSLKNMSYDDIMTGLNVNYLGAIIVAKESYPYLKETKGALLLYTSSSYTRGRGLYSIYSSTKAAIVNLIQALSEEWEHVRINCINPERTLTPMRVKNFGNEPEGTLLDSIKVAKVSLSVVLSEKTGQIIDVKR